MARDPRLAAAAAKAAEYYGDKGFNGRINRYQCEASRLHAIVTIDREPGVTPFTTPCPHCEKAGVLAEKGFYKHPAMESSFYRVPPGLVPTHEWYRPDSLAGLNPGTVDHLLNGGLILREIAKSEPEAA